MATNPKLNYAAMAQRAQTAAKLAEAARPGPWITRKYPGEVDWVRQETWTPCGIEGHDDCAITQVSRSLGTPEVALCLVDHSWEHLRSDAIFIAASRTAVPALAADVLALLAEVAHLQALVAAYQDATA